MKEIKFKYVIKAYKTDKDYVEAIGNENTNPELLEVGE